MSFSAVLSISMFLVEKCTCVHPRVQHMVCWLALCFHDESQNIILRLDGEPQRPHVYGLIIRHREHHLWCLMPKSLYTVTRKSMSYWRWQTKLNYFDFNRMLLAVHDHNVLWFQVGMDNSHWAQIRKSCGQLINYWPQLCCWKALVLSVFHARISADPGVQN